MIPVHEIVPGALATVLREAPLTADKVSFAWRTAVGPSVSRVSAIELKGHVLHVRVNEVAWQREIERSSGVIRSRLGRLLGDDVVRGLHVTVA